MFIKSDFSLHTTELTWVIYTMKGLYDTFQFLHFWNFLFEKDVRISVRRARLKLKIFLRASEIVVTKCVRLESP